ncbi:aldehyde dehydrogenase [Ruegeria sediminis]|uniref:Aldehyde dehydrogenase n=1 Tax=Ruegeria sediminis TaxID=2583820 RepID=A0ABY2X3I5_9RHOB|nr:aldehyde dehydrogenase family protein [Ruegeria sediminis]TMV09946.1 aldehyde dehydrogenase [Ruegeria sediminis]
MQDHPRYPTDIAQATAQWIGGAFRPGEGSMRVLLDPATQNGIARVPDAAAVQVTQAVEAAAQALGRWARRLPADRARVLTRLAGLLEEKADHLAALEALNVGKPLSQARRDVLRAADYFRFYAGACDKLNGETIPLGPDQTALTLPEPVGVTAHILPWNYPLSTLARGVAPALAVGATVVAKPSELTPLTTLRMAELAQAAGLPDGAFNVVTGGAEVGAMLAGHPGIAHVTFTGSTATGQKVMQAAAAPVAGVTLELGGKSPVIVLEDADLDLAARDIARGIFFNAGQVCAAGSRLIAQDSVHDDLIARLVTEAKALGMGHPLDDPALGPLVSRAQFKRVAGYVDRARAAGLTCVLGGEPAPLPAPLDKGNFYPPTIFADVPAEAEIACDEVFGPVLATFRVPDADAALALANASPFGLVAGVYSADATTALRLARGLEAGQVFVNGFLKAGDTVPFGGVKTSGIGREKGLAGLATYTAPKSIILNHPG